MPSTLQRQCLRLSVAGKWSVFMNASISVLNLLRASVHLHFLPAPSCSAQLVETTAGSTMTSSSDPSSSLCTMPATWATGTATWCTVQGPTATTFSIILFFWCSTAVRCFFSHTSAKNLGSTRRMQRAGASGSCPPHPNCCTSVSIKSHSPYWTTMETFCRSTPWMNMVQDLRDGLSSCNIPILMLPWQQ